MMRSLYSLYPVGGVLHPLVQVDPVLDEEAGQIEQGVTLGHHRVTHVHPPVEPEPTHYCQHCHHVETRSSPQPDLQVGGRLPQEGPGMDAVQVAVRPAVGALAGQDVHLQQQV